jgi:hypothetical protein
MKIMAFLTLIALIAVAFEYRRRPAAIADARSFIEGLPALTPELRLVVARVDFNESIGARSPKVAWGVDWGTTKAVLSVPVHAHYAVDFSGPRPVDFSDDSARGELTAVFPDPEVQAVEIAYGRRSTIVEPGWGRLASLSGNALLDDLSRRVDEVARKNAGAGRRRAAEVARPELARLLDSYLKQAGMRRRVVVRFRSEKSAEIAPPALASAGI